MCGCGDLKYPKKNHTHSQYVTVKELNQVLGSYLTGDEVLDYLAANYYTKSEVDDLLALLEAKLPPVGSIMAWPTNSIPDGWLVCDGTEFDDSPTGYPLLFAALGTTTLPNIQGKTIVGWKNGDADFNTIGADGGVKDVSLSIAQMPQHGHKFKTRAGTDADTITYTNVTGLSNRFVVGGGGGTEQTQTPFIELVGGNEAHTNLMPYNVRHWIIRGR